MAPGDPSSDELDPLRQALAQPDLGMAEEDPKSHDKHIGGEGINKNEAIKPRDPLKRFFPVFHLGIRDHIKTFLLLSLSLAFFPSSLLMVFLLESLPLSWITYLFPFSTTLLSQCRATAGFQQRTVLVTGVSMTKGLTLARAFYLAGHRVVGADFDILRSSVWLPKVLGGRRFSNAFSAVYHLQKPVYEADMTKLERERVAYIYALGMMKIMENEGVDLWVSCSGVASAAEDGLVPTVLVKENGPRTKCVQFDEAMTMKLHEKNTFVRYMKELGLPVPETHEVDSRVQATEILLDNMNTGRKFILKPVGMDDAHRGNMTLLPLSREPGTEVYPGADTEQYVHTLPISKGRPWILQQFIAGNKEYCTHALVVDGKVKVFVACPSSELLMHYQALPADDPLSQEMLAFTKKVAKAGKQAPGSSQFTGHLSFDFMVEEDFENDVKKTKMYAIECNPRAHTAVVLFDTQGPEMHDMVDAYMSVLEPPEKKEPGHLESIRSPGVVRPPVDVSPRYWIGHDLVVLLLLPLWRLLVRPFSVFEFTNQVSQFVEHVQWWQDGTFEMWDPWPFVALYHVYWPKAIMEAWWRGERWSRVNVSTTKMFAC